MGKNKVSIIVPCYNVQEYVCDCIDSVLASTYENMEIIIVDDGSTDQTPLRLNSYKGRGNVVVVRKENGGLSSARNCGLAHATGEFALFIDSDDWIAPQAVEIAVSEAERLNCDVLTINKMVVVQKPSGEEIRSAQEVKMPACETHGQVMNEAFAGLIGISAEDIDVWNRSGKIDRLKVHGYAAGILYRMDLIKKNGLYFDESIKFREDVYYNLSFFLHSERIGSVDEPLYFYRIRADGTNSVARKWQNGEAEYGQKVQGVEKRVELRSKALEQDGIDIRPWYCGSIALSAIELALTCARDSKCLGIDAYRKYFNTEVRECIRLVPMSVRNIKFSFPILLLKIHLEAIVYYLIRLLTISGLDGKVTPSGIANA